MIKIHNINKLQTCYNSGHKLQTRDKVDTINIHKRLIQPSLRGTKIKHRLSESKAKLV